MAGNRTNLEVGLSFSADTTKARREIIALQNEFNKLATSTNLQSKDFGITEASKAAAELAANLQLATNFETGKLDLTKFQRNLQASGKELKDYKETLSKFGPEGKKAFNDLADAILQAEVPLTKANKLVSQLWYSFKQTAKYQFTSSIYRGLISGIRSAYNYAQDLNESLNNIRIVTGQSTDQMAKFAEQANKAARALSATTTDYTNAALIYYRQGLSDEEAQARTDVTMKLANASGVSAETAAEQMTAIWNNFAKGAENLEYFADVITALGASTASSTSEIAEGLEKFAAIGNTVGLSYEYAASALATVTATTRQSADVVGTAFKTLFARIQDLEVGETLEDGTTLGKYSQALATVGVNIKDANGELKQMDQILEEMAAAWNTISKDQQVALAQTVAGTRQYTQLVALMENWSFMQKNLQTSYGSSGTVQKQQEIYAESWEAARDRVKAAAEGIYKSLFNDEFFIKITNAVEKVVVFIDNLIDSFGGLKGTLLTLGPMILTLFGTQIDASIRNSIDRIKDLTHQTEKASIRFKEQVNLLKFEDSDTGGYTASVSGRSGDALYRIQMQHKELSDFLIKNNATLTEYEQKQVQLNLDRLSYKEKELQNLDQEIQKYEEIIKLQKEGVSAAINSSINLEGKAPEASKASQVLGYIQDAQAKFAGNNFVNNKDIISNYLDYNKINELLPEKLKSKFDSLLEKSGEEFEIELQKFLDSLKRTIKNGEKKVKEAQAEINSEVGARQGKIREHSEKIGVLKEMKTINVATPEGSESAQRLFESLGLSRNFKLSKFFSSEDVNNVEAYQKAVDAAIKTVKGHISTEEEDIDKTLQKKEVTEEATAEIREKTEEMKKAGEAAGKYSASVSITADEERKLAEQTMGIRPVFADNITIFRQSVSAISAISGAVTTAINSIETLGKKEATFSQKLSAATALLTSTFMAYNSVRTLTATFGKIIQAENEKELTGISKKIFLKYQEIIAEKAATGAKLEGAAASHALATATLSVVWPLLAVAAAIGGIVIIAKILKADADAAEKASEKAKELSDSYKELKESVNAFKESVSGYNEAVEGLDKLIEGTQEYREQLEKANEEAKKIIDANGQELTGKWHYNANGLITFDSGALDDLERSLGRSLSESQKKVIESQKEANTAQLKSALTDLVRSDGAGSNNAQREAINKLAEEYSRNQQNLGAALSTLSSTERELIKGLDVEPYLKQVYQYQQEEINYNRQLALDFIQYHKDWNDYYNGTGSELEKEIFVDLADQFTNVTVKQQVEDRNQSYNFSTEALLHALSVESEFDDNFQETIDRIDKNNIVDKEIVAGLEATEDAIYLYGQEIASKQDGTIKVIGYAQYIAGRVNEKFEKDIIDIVVAGINANRPKTTLISAQEISDEFLRYFSTESGALQFIQNFKAGKGIDYSGLTQKKAGEFSTALTNENNPLYNYYKDYFGEDTEGFQNFLKTTESQFATYKLQFNQFAKDLSENTNEIIKNFFGKDLEEYTLEEAEAITTNLEKAFATGGNKGVEALSSILKGQKDPLGILTALKGIDWRTTDFEEVSKTLKRLGYSFDSKAVKQYTEAMQEAAQQSYILNTSLKGLLDSLKEIKDIVSKLSFGTVISDEDYQKLIKERADLKGKFIYTVDGWQYVGNKEDLTNSNNYSIFGDIEDSFKQGRTDTASVQAQESAISEYREKDNIVEIAKLFSGNAFNTTAAGIAGYNQDKIDQAIIDSSSKNEKVKKAAEETLRAYSNAILELLTNGDERFSVENEATAFIAEKYDTLEDLLNDWKTLVDKYGEDVIGNKKNSLIRSTAFDELTNLGIDPKKLDDYIDIVEDLDGTLKNSEEDATKAAIAYAKFEKEVSDAGLNIDDWKDYYEYLMRTEPALRNNAIAAQRLAKANMLVQKSINSLNSNFENYYKGLLSEEGTQVYKDSITGLVNDIAGMYNITAEEALTKLNELSKEFWFAEQKTVEAAMNNEEGAMIKLLQDIVLASGYTQEEWNILKATIESTPINGKIEIDANWSEKAKEAIKFFAGTITDTSGQLFKTGGDISSLIKEDKNKGKSKSLKRLDDEIDRYHYIRKLLADIERELERVDKVKERAYGAQHLKYLDQEIEYLKEQAGLQDRYVNEIESYLSKDRGLIAAYGAKFDQYGNISNYDQMFAANFKKYANAEDSTNWENFKKALSQYEETLQLWFDETEKKAELLRQILDKRLEGIQYKVQVKVELDDREIALLEHQLNRLDDAAYDTAEALVNIGSQFELVEDKIKQNTDGIIDTLNTIPGITQAQIDAYLAGDSEALAGLHIEQGQLDMLEDYSDQLLELSNTLKELHDNALQKVSEAFDAWGEKIEDHVAKFQHLNTLIDNYQEIIGLLGRSNIGISNEFMRQMRNQQITNLQGIVETRTQTKDNLASQLANARKRASEAATDAEREDWEKVADDIEQRLKEATESWQEAWIDALQANKEAFEETMQELVDSFDDYADELKRYDTAQDRYLETYRQAYELSKLTRDIDNSINDQDSIRAKKELQKLEDKITAIKESGRAISENELDLLRKEYELRLAEIALEDAQNAKSLVRLNRDNEGNWGYVYTADQDKINEAQQNYEDKLYEYMRQADTMAEESSRSILTLNKEMAEALAALDANAEDYEAKAAEITQFYADQIEYFAEQYGISTDAMTNVARESAAKYKPEVVDIIDSDNSGLQTNFAETVLAIIGDFEDLEDAVNGPDGALPRIREAYTQTITAFEDYREQNAETCRLAGVDVNNMSEEMQKAFENIRQKSQTVKTSTAELTEEMKDYLGSVLTEFGNFASKYSAKIEVVNTANETLAQSIITLERVLQGLNGGSLNTLKKAADQVAATAQKVRDISNSAGDDGLGNIDKTPAPQITKISYEKIGGNTKQHYRVEEYDNGARVRVPENHNWIPGGAGKVCPKCSAMLAYNWGRDKKDEEWVPVNFDTGGYTGEWGTSGQLAVLHEKELVLNQEDTANILDAVSLIRQMTLGTAQLSMGLGNLGAGLNNLSINPASMDQHVEIAASFPGVTDRYEIEEAFNNLVNKASQYAFRETTRYEPKYI